MRQGRFNSFKAGGTESWGNKLQGNSDSNSQLPPWRPCCREIEELASSVPVSSSQHTLQEQGHVDGPGVKF